MHFVVKKVSKGQDGRCLLTGFIVGVDNEEDETIKEMCDAYKSVTSYTKLTNHMSSNGKTILLKSIPIDGVQLVLNFWIQSLGVNIDYKISDKAVYLDGFNQKSVIDQFKMYKTNEFKLNA